MSAIPCSPPFDIGDVVVYRDRQGRHQTGAVQAIEARWDWKRGKEPLMLITLHHPSYRNRTFYGTPDDIFSLSQEPRHDR
jgi:hypothetical protein